MQVEEIKPCPVCGEPGELIQSEWMRQSDSYNYYVACSQCSMNGPRYWDSEGGEHRAIAVWNSLSYAAELVQAMSGLSTWLAGDSQRVLEIARDNAQFEARTTEPTDNGGSTSWCVRSALAHDAIISLAQWRQEHANK